MEKLVAIIDVMPEYGRRLAAYLNNSRTFPYRAVVFSSADEAESYIKNDGVYAVLAAEELEKAVLDVVVGTGVKLFWLRERKDAYGGSSMYRYGSAKEIERGLTETKEREKRIPVIGFFSPAGGAEAELLSRKIAGELGKKGKVLYFSMFPFGIYGRECEDETSVAEIAAVWGIYGQHWTGTVVYGFKQCDKNGYGVFFSKRTLGDKISGLLCGGRTV